MTSMEQNQDLNERLRNIFSLCDDDDDGYISADHFAKLAQDHFGAAGLQEITGIIHLLDPEGKGLISFDNFCDGIKQILEIQNQIHVNDSTFKKNIRDVSYIQNVNGDSSNGDSHLTYSEYDLPSGEDITDKGALTNGDVTPIGQIQHGFLHPQNSEDEGDSAISGKSSEISRQEVTDEENYEDFGEIESEADISDQGLLTPVTLRKRDELGRPHKRTCLNRRLTSAAYASQLQRGARESPNSTRRSSFGSDGLYDHIDENFDDLNGRVKYLESQLTKLCEHQMTTDTKHANLKKENGQLTEKVHYMEEQLRFMETKSEELVRDERRKLQDSVASQIRSKTDHIDYITQRLQKLEVENEQLREEAPRLREEINRLRSEKQQCEELYDSLSEDYKKLEAEYQLQQSVFKKERESTDKLLDELGAELHELRRMKIESDTHGRGSVTSYGAHYGDLEMEILRLKESYMEEWNNLFQENRNLHESNEELNAQLLSRCMEEGRSLLRETHELSLAEELEHLTKEELLERLKKEQDCNLRLKQYVDKILLTIIDKNPSLLEITNK